MKEYSLNLADALKNSELGCATAEELRVLLAIAAGASSYSEGELASLCGVTPARLASALTFWQAAGIISEKRDTGSTITDEFEEKITLGKIIDTTAEKTATDIRDNDLAGLISECATLMDKPALSTEEITIISALYTQYALGEEYIITLAAYISERGRLTAVRLGTEAERLVKRGISSIEELEKYIEARQSESGAEWEFRHLIGIYNRSLSKKEQEFVKRWYHEMAYGEDVIGEAYDITVLNTGKLSLPYMDKLLTHWSEAGCKTLEDCTALIERERTAKAAETSEKAPPKLPRTQKQTPRYGDFDPLEAFERALQRSYSDDDE